MAAEMNGRNDKVRSLTFGAYLTSQWLPGKKITLAEPTWDGYRRKIDRHILPAIGHLRIRRLRAHHLEKLYDRMPHSTDGRRPLAPKTVLEVHLIIRGGLKDAVTRGLVNRNVALAAHAPKLKAIPKVEPQAWTAQQLQGFLQATAGHRLFPAFWLLAANGINVLKAWREWQAAGQDAAGVESEDWVHQPRRQTRPPPFDLPDLRADRQPGRSPKNPPARHPPHPRDLLIKAGVPVKVVSERLGHGNPAFTIHTYRHVLPACR